MRKQTKTNKFFSTYFLQLEFPSNFSASLSKLPSKVCWHSSLSIPLLPFSLQPISVRSFLSPFYGNSSCVSVILWSFLTQLITTLDFQDALLGFSILCWCLLSVLCSLVLVSWPVNGGHIRSSLFHSLHSLPHGCVIYVLKMSNFFFQFRLLSHTDSNTQMSTWCISWMLKSYL